MKNRTARLIGFSGATLFGSLVAGGMTHEMLRSEYRADERAAQEIENYQDDRPTIELGLQSALDKAGADLRYIDTRIGEVCMSLFNLYDLPATIDEALTDSGCDITWVQFRDAKSVRDAAVSRVGNLTAMLDDVSGDSRIGLIMQERMRAILDDGQDTSVFGDLFDFRQSIGDITVVAGDGRGGYKYTVLEIPDENKGRIAALLFVAAATLALCAFAANEISILWLEVRKRILVIKWDKAVARASPEDFEDADSNDLGR